MEFIAFAEVAGKRAGVIFSQEQQKRLGQGEPWPPLPRATWETREKGVLSLSILSRAVWPDVPDLWALRRKTGLLVDDPDPWVRAEALGKLLLLVMEEVRSWPPSARKELAEILPEGWSLPPPRPRLRPRLPRDLEEAFRRLGEKGLSLRKTQQDYAAQVAKALEGGRVVLLEAGPGTGKTFGYLIPLLLALQKGGRAVVATRTRTLQDQLWKKDLPWLEENLGLKVERALLKGRENYICLRRLEEMERRLVPEDVLLPLRVFSARSGDLDEVAFVDEPWLIEELRDRPWRCLGQRCRHWGRCPSRRAREEARAAKLVVVNHALLGADLAAENALLGKYDFLIVDEAHALPHALREALSLAISPGDLPAILAELRRLDSERIKALEEKVNASHREFWDYVQSVIPPGRGRLKPEISSLLLGRAGPLVAALEELVRALRSEEEGELLGSVLEYRETLGRVLSPGLGEWVQWFIREEELTLGLTPLNLAEELSQNLWPKVNAAVLTSATLAVSGSSSFLLSRLGLPEETPFYSWPSPFSYERVRIAILAGLPEPDDPEYPQALALTLRRVVEVAPVKVLVLFTARRALAAVRGHLAGVPHLAQGWDGERDQLLRRFRAMPPPAILLGLESFWEGVDLPGKDLEILVVARLPFPHPAEPVLEAEAEKIRAQGKNDFHELSLPLAVLKLRQGLGRLVRTPTDRGVILIADPRLSSRSYRRAFLSSFPVPPQILRNPDELEVVLREVFR
ncbi:ATP-dependent DNA helicase [Candidatus Bipolaricaulota bacterium]|nr:ATP-dependent DNA helicase [Candidatus Bipolaricaulota bacterium]